MAKIEAIGLAWDAIVELAKRSRGGDQNAASEVAKYGGEGRILDQYGDPRSMDMSNLDAAPDVPQFDLERYNPPRGRPPNLDPLLTPETAGRMEEYARRGEKVGGRAWYNTMPLRQEFISELGENEGIAAFNRYMDIVAATSPRSRVDANIRRSSYLYGEDVAGRPIAGLTNADFPPGYGHLAHLTQDASLKDLQGGGHFQSLNRPKTSSFAENLKGNQQPMTIDTHNFSAITGNVKNKKSPSGTQYKYLEDFQVEIADKLSMTPAQFQASVWMGADTGVANARPFLEVFDDVVARTAKKNGTTKQDALKKFIRGDAPLWGLATLLTTGALVPSDAEASVVGTVLKNLDDIMSQGQNVARGVGSLPGASGRTFKNQADETIARVYDNLRTQKDQYGEPVFDQLPVGNIEGATGRSGASPVARYRMPEGYAGSLEELNRASPDLIEIAPDSTGAGYFSQQITSAKDANKYGASVYVYPENEYQQMRLFVTEDGSAGYALKPDGDVVSAFSAGRHKGVAQNILLHAVEQGGTKLDAFDTVLPDLYSTMGFRESGRLPWDDAQAPDEWNKAVFSAFNEGEPDVSFMAYNKDPAIPVEPQYANDYDAAMKAQGRDVARLASAYEKVSSPQAEGVARMVEQGQISPEQADKYTNTIKAYKLFRTKGGNTDELFPLFVNANKPVNMGEWNPAESGLLTDAGKVKSSIGPLAYRPGWHAGDAPVATHIGGKSDSSLKAPDYRPADQVWAEVEMPADVDWQSVADSRMEYSKAGNPIPRTAQITDQIPEGGYYRYKTNPNMTGDWLIAGDMKVNRVLTPSEVYQINAERGVHDLPPVDDNGKMLWSLALGSGLTAAGIAPEEAKAELLSEVPQEQAQQLQDNWSQIEANAQAGMGGMGVRSAPVTQDEEAIIAAQQPAPTGADLMQQANDDFLSGIFNQPGSFFNPETYDVIGDTARGAFDATVGFLGDMEQMLVGGIMQGIGGATTWEDALKMIGGGLGQEIINAPEGRGSRFMEGMKNYDPAFITSGEVGQVPGMIPSFGTQDEERTKRAKMLGGFFAPI